MNYTLKDLLLIQSFDLSGLMEEYRLFFIGLLPSAFILSLLFEYFSSLDPFSVVKRVIGSILILCTVESFYYQSVHASLDVADGILNKQRNIIFSESGGWGRWFDFRTSKKKKDFYKEYNLFTGFMDMLKAHLFYDSANDLFTIILTFISKVCFIILKLIYSLVYYLGFGLVGIPCLLFLFSGLTGVMRGAVSSWLWLLVAPHVLVFILIMIGNEISQGYVQGQVIGGSIMGTVLIFVLALFIVFVPVITNFILSGVGVSGAGGAIAAIASIGTGFVMSLPKKTFQSAFFLSLGTTTPFKMLANFIRERFTSSSSQDSSQKPLIPMLNKDSLNKKMDIKKIPGEKGGIMLTEKKENVSPNEWNYLAKAKYHLRGVKPSSSLNQNKPKFTLDDGPTPRPSRPSQSFRSPSDTNITKGKK